MTPNLRLRYKKYLEKHTDAVDAIPGASAGLWIALAAAVCLFTELLTIRLHSSFFQLFAYFKNVSLLSCFLGLGIGYARGPKRPLATPLVLPLFALQIIFLQALRHAPLAGILHNPVSEELALGLEQADTVLQFISGYGFLSFFFALNALCFIPMGHLTSRLMMRRPPLIAYGWNLTGSLAGIALFSLVSLAWTPPSVWIALSALGLAAFFRRDNLGMLLMLASVLAALIVLGMPSNPDQVDIYSPYQTLTVSLSKGKNGGIVLKTSDSYFQRILDLGEKNVRGDEWLTRWSAFYNFPYDFKPAPGRVLIVGSGAGNDVAAALRHRSKIVDAVEIDPAILRLGKTRHPESPYQAGNVNIAVEDARTFIRRTKHRYDLIVYGLLDSHALLSGQSGGIRLDSYVYTVEAFREAKARLKNDGLLCLSFYVLDPELGRKLFLMLETAFDGIQPVVYQLNRTRGYVFLISRDPNARLMLRHPQFMDVTKGLAHRGLNADLPTDDWPFFYMPAKKYPYSYLLVILSLLFISIAGIRKFIPEAKNNFSPACFFLGAGFMLIETKAITELALVYGSTWAVTSIVISFALIMSFLANGLVIKKAVFPPPVTYGLIFISLTAGLGWNLTHANDFAAQSDRWIRPVILTCPLFFSGLAFSYELKKSNSAAIALSSNLLGAMLGGFLEYNSMRFGFRSLYLFAGIMYAAAFYIRRTGSPKPTVNRTPLAGGS